eukprot:TRINITY_DN762_c0_g1_i2.p1 TRINITY_DN762_c0_g1~~TRINITY_DN762_c0_g1_i2.p1  ORF type:complete len:520 (+),score=61.26 TRINITY_DN762_c0_g1_i2:51-1610(+)
MDQRQDTRFDPKTAAPMATSVGSFPGRTPNFPTFGQPWQQIPPSFTGMPAAGMPPHHDPLIADPVLAAQPGAVGQPPFHRMDFYPPVKAEPALVPNGQSFAVGIHEIQANAGATPLKPITLMFNSVAWQNRPARIYISGEGVDPDHRCLADLNTFPRYLVLSAQDQGRNEKGASSPSKRKVLVAPDGKEITIFNYIDSSREEDFFFELQVWRRGDANGASPPRLLLDSSGPTLPSSKNSTLVWFEKMGFNKRELYITINCEKGLRVQDLFVIGILKLGNALYLSPETSFPAPSSRRKNANGTGLVETIRSPTTSTASQPASSASRSGGSISSSQTWSDTSSRSRSAMSMDPAPAAKRRKTGEEPETEAALAWAKLTAEISELHLPAALHQQMDHLFQVNSDLEGVEIDRIKAEWIEWFESTTSVVPDRTAVLKHVFASALSVSCFFGTLSANTSAQILRHQGQLYPLQDAFILRLSRSKRPYFGLDARFLDVQTSQQVIYNSSILTPSTHYSSAVFRPP